MNYICLDFSVTLYNKVSFVNIIANTNLLQYFFIFVNVR